MHNSKKVVLLGHFGVGKTSLIRRFVENSFSDNYKVTIGVHISKKVLKLDKDRSVSLIIWDLEGTDELASIRNSLLLGTHGIIYVFDLSRPSTFADLDKNIELIKNRLSETPMIIVGNKKDLINKEKLESLQQQQSFPFDFLTSAKTGNTVPDAFQHLAKALI
jgi:small GTP-binding protein